jgi:RNA polymerase sigma factor (sigma-70 family)
VDDSPKRQDDAERQQVRSALAQLPERQRLALFLRYYADFDYSQIAETLGIKVGTVSATLSAARANVARLFEEVGT